MAQRPSLLLRGEWDLVATALQNLRAVYQDDAHLAIMAEAQPALLSSDVPVLLSELRRCECRVLTSDAKRDARVLISAFT